MESVALATAETRPARRASGRGLHTKDRAMRQKPRGKGSLPEYLEAAEVEDLIRQAHHLAVPGAPLGFCEVVDAAPTAKKNPAVDHADMEAVVAGAQWAGAVVFAPLLDQAERGGQLGGGRLYRLMSARRRDTSRRTRLRSPARRSPRCDGREGSSASSWR